MSLHNGTSPGETVLCGQLRARVEFTKHAAVWEGACRAGTACLKCSAKEQARRAAVLVWPWLFLPARPLSR